MLAQLPAQFLWLRYTCALAAAVVSAAALVMKNERNAIESADLHSRWQSLAIDFERLWSDVYANGAAEALLLLRRREAEVSKSSTAMPSYTSMLEKAQDNVLMHHQTA